MCRFIIFALLLAGPVWAEECNNVRLQQCRNVISDEIDRRGSSVPRQELMNHCRSLVDSLHCVVWQSSNCLSLEERQRNSETIWKAWKYITNACENVIQWRLTPCFQREDIRRCDSLIQDNLRTPDQESCRKFSSYKDCVESIVRAQCQVEDQSTATLHFLDKGREMAWMCSMQEGRDRPSWQYQQQPLADSPDAQDAICLSRAAGALRSCTEQQYRDQDGARRHRDNQERQTAECCTTVNYDRCVRQAIHDVCPYARDSVIQSVTGQNDVRRDPRCRYYSETECSPASVATPTAFLVLSVVFLTLRKNICG